MSFICTVIAALSICVTAERISSYYDYINSTDDSEEKEKSKK